MKNICIKIIIPILAIFGFVQISALESKKDQKDIKNKCTQYHNRMSCFFPLYQCYERIKNDAFYAGVEGWITSGFPKHVIGEAEFRMGYNFFFNCKDHLRPFVGIGVFKDFKEKKFYYVNKKEDGNFEVDVDDSNLHFKHSRPLLIYGTVGFIYDHEFNSIFNLGFNAKGIFGGPSKKVRKNSIAVQHFDWGKSVAGVDVAIPFTFRFGRDRHWDYRLEPFDIYIHGQTKSMNYWGFRSTLGYRF